MFICKQLNISLKIKLQCSPLRTLILLVNVLIIVLVRITIEIINVVKVSCLSIEDRIAKKLFMLNKRRICWMAKYCSEIVIIA